MSTTETTTTTTPENTPKTKTANHDDTTWTARLEELLKVKNLEELRSELSNLASEVQSEIQAFDLNAHLSPEAKSRLKTLEQRYNRVIRTIQKAQKQFDREFNKSLRVLKRTRQDAEKHIQNIKTKIAKHRVTIVKASNDLKNKLNKKATKKKSSTKAKKTTKRAAKKTKKSN